MRGSALFAIVLSAAMAVSIASPSRAATHARKRKKHSRHISSLEKTVELLELRIKKLEEVNDRLEHERLQPLDQRVKILDRRLEVQQEEAHEKAKIAPSIEASPKGFFLYSADKSFSLRVGGYIQADGRFYTTDTKPSGSTFVMRRVRPILEGTVFKYFDYRIMPDFGSGTTVLEDAYMNVHYHPGLQFQIGKFKSPFGLERLQSAANLLFVDRALTINLVPFRDIGVQLHGDLFANRLDYQLGLFNGAPDNTATFDIDNNDAKDFVGRLFAHPFRGTTWEFASGWGVGIAGSVGNERGPLATLRTVGQTTFFSYNSGVVAAGQRFRYSPQTYFYHGPFGLLAEFVQNSQQVRLAKMSERISDQAWQIAASYLLTGDDASYTGVKPRHNFDPFTGGWGAVEVAARVSNLGVDRDAFTNHFADLTTSSRDAFEWGFGLNWYLNSNFKFQADYIRTSFNRGGINAHNRKDESAVLTRAQVAF